MGFATVILKRNNLKRTIAGEMNLALASTRFVFSINYINQP